jgi:hypothetical protein
VLIAIKGKWACTRKIHYLNVTSAREIFTEFVERDSHDSVGRVESFFDTVSVVNINVDVQNALVVSTQNVSPTNEDGITLVLPIDRNGTLTLEVPK